MSDLVAPILAEVLDESDTFWCFVGLMQNTIFISSPRDEDMEKQLVRLGVEALLCFLSIPFPVIPQEIPSMESIPGAAKDPVYPTGETEGCEEFCQKSRNGEVVLARSPGNAKISTSWQLPGLPAQIQHSCCQHVIFWIGGSNNRCSQLRVGLWASIDPGGCKEGM